MINMLLIIKELGPLVYAHSKIVWYNLSCCVKIGYLLR